MLETVTHVAGPVVGYKDRGVQRCIVCGEKLLDTKGDNVMEPKDGSIGGAVEAGWFGFLDLIRVKQGSKVRVGRLDDGRKMPEDNCFALVE